MRSDAFGSAEAGEFDEKGASDNGATRLFQQVAAGINGAACGKQIVHHQNILAFGHAINVHLQRIRAILQFIMKRVRVKGQFARLANGYETGVQLKGQWRGEDKAPSFRGNDRIDLAVREVSGHLPNRFAKRLRSSQQRGNVAKQDSGLRKIRDIANKLFQIQRVGHSTFLSFM